MTDHNDLQMRPKWTYLIFHYNFSWISVYKKNERKIYNVPIIANDFNGFNNLCFC